MKPLKKTLSILFIVFLAICAFIVYIGWVFLNTPLIPKDGKAQNFIFYQGSSVKKAANSLKDQGLIEHPLFFILYARISGDQHKLQAGEYLIEPGVTPRELVQKMVKGDVISHHFTVVEGWTFAQMIDALNKNENIKHAIKGLSGDKIMEKIGHHGEIPEGKFAPDTYQFRKGISDIDILMASYQLMNKRLQKAWDKRAKNLPYKCSYDALIVASLIEKETAANHERTIISGVILRRLRKGMLLQIDPAVIYGLGDEYAGRLRKKDMRKDTPYNTYTRRGLPPTPIALPSEASIIAALNPADGNELYYVSKGDGTHKFSATHKEQVKAIRKYIHKKN